ncbi:GNAT family N-acetyltransferase [Kibdelosporangium philippinense]|uniref:GNAT family N-acetyltransferase n=1 Tax=Kibdelosporangium philippinense TaxID=211113 RepID=A0ABS8ZQ56_9PSEU|nr:GNAT family N-acetyltransferase [Kibdelosporangium philippinense]MCE7009886.1 GNAT family N-acetyltransferase [Kibdelosporangium philippinense]
MESAMLKPSDAQLILAMNNAAVPNVNEATEAELAALIEMSELTVALKDGETVLGFVLTLPPGVDYASENYAFFSSRYDQFVYVDRIVVAEEARNRGIGVKLYDIVSEFAKEHGGERVLCEVNLEPPNPGSLRFHKRIGFVEVGQQRTKGGTYLVSLLAKEV